jgi:hypothetical protein
LIIADSSKCPWLRDPDLLAPLALLVLGLLFFGDFLFSSKNFYYRDILNFHYPLRRVLIDAYARGEVPLWNPYISLGQPMLANPNYMAFYPTNLLHLLLPFNYAFKLHFIIHPLLAGIGMYFLQRRLRISALAAFAGALAYQFSGTVLSFLNLYNVVPAVALLPWLGWAFLRALPDRWFKSALLFGGLLALQVIALEPLIFLCDLCLLAGLSLYSVLQSNDRSAAIKSVCRAGATGALFAAGLSAIQVLPTLELLPLSARAAYDFQVTLWSMHPLDLLNSLVPNLFGDPYTIDYSTYWGEAFHDNREGYLVSYFLGSCTLLLAAISPASQRKNLKHVCAGLACFGIILALGSFTPVYGFLLRYLPLFNLGRYPSKCFLLATLSFCLLASLGLEALFHLQERASNRRYILTAGICGLVLAAAVLGFWVLSLNHPAPLEAWVRTALSPDRLTAKKLPVILSSLNQSILSCGAFLALCASLIVFRPSWKRPVLPASLLVMLIVAELVPANIRLSPLISDEAASFVPDAYPYISKNLPNNASRATPLFILDPPPRVAILASRNNSAWFTLLERWTTRSYFGITQGIQYALNDPVDNLCILESDQLRLGCKPLSDSRRLEIMKRLNSGVIMSLKELKHGGLRYLSSFSTPSDQTLRLYSLDQAAPRAYFVSAAETASSPVAALRRFLSPEFPYQTSVILEDRAAAADPAPTSSGSTSVLEYRSNMVSCRVEAPSAGYLVLLDSYYPGWSAFLDGSRTPVLRANYAFRAVRVPAGTHQVEFRFRPRSFYIGACLTALTLTCGLLCFGLALLVGRKRDQALETVPDKGRHGTSSFLR